MGFKINTILLLFLSISFHSTTNGQKAKAHVLTADEAKMVKKDAATLFSSQDYRGALNAYKDLIKSDPNNTEFNYRLGYCYLQTQINKPLALEYMLKAMQGKDAKKEWNYSLGMAHMYNNQWDEAISAFTEYQNAKIKPTKDNFPVDRLIEMCANGKDLVSKPVKCTFTNLGKNINTIYEEYSPFISADGKTLVFTSRRKGNSGGFIEDLGIFTSDIYWSIWKDTLWTKAKGIGGGVNSEWDEESVGLSPIGDQVMIYFDNTESFADIGFALLKGKMWQRPIMFNTQINSKQYEGAATMTADGNTVYFSSNRKEGNGGGDIWIIQKEKNGEWAAPVNLGLTINTKYDEDFPMLSLDGKSLYFSSKGWNSMGGFDIFRSDYDENAKAWGKPINIGYPLNDADDNSFISFTGDGKTAYITAIRPGGLGDRDIYKVQFDDESHHKFSKVLSGTVTSAIGKIELTKVTLTNTSTSKQAEFRPAGPTNAFVFAVAPGVYTIKVEGYNFPSFTDTLTIDNDMTTTSVVKNIQVVAGK